MSHNVKDLGSRGDTLESTNIEKRWFVQGVTASDQRVMAAEHELDGIVSFNSGPLSEHEI